MTEPRIPPKIEIPEVTPSTAELLVSALIGCELGVVDEEDVEVDVDVVIGDAESVVVADAEAVGVAVLDEDAFAVKVDDAEAVDKAVAEACVESVVVAEVDADADDVDDLVEEAVAVPVAVPEAEGAAQLRATMPASPGNPSWLQPQFCGAAPPSPGFEDANDAPAGPPVAKICDDPAATLHDNPGPGIASAPPLLGLPRPPAPPPLPL
jgi:hypothetical protein